MKAKADSAQVEVPGGQQVYVAPNGALGFTQAHSASTPRMYPQTPFRQNPLFHKYWDNDPDDRLLSIDASF
jgi:hypothetical protein